MKTLFGMAVCVMPDVPKLQLGDGSQLMAGDFVTPECRRETNAWLLSFFGTTNQLEDGVTYVSQVASVIWVNPRTLHQIERAANDWQ